MADALAETATCPKCQADVRPGSAFCYNCGGQIGEDEPETSSPVGAVEGEKPKPQFEKPTQPAPGLRTARDIRRRERATERKPRGIAWEPVGGSEIQLLILCGAVLVFTIVVICLALYLK